MTARIHNTYRKTQRHAQHITGPRVPVGAAIFAVLAIWCALNHAARVASADNWPGWRGNGSGTSEEIGLPSHWSRHENIRWRTQIAGNGVSSPIAWNDRLFVTTAVTGADLRNQHLLAAAVLYGLLAVALSAAAMQCARRGSTPPAQVTRARRLLFLAMRLDRAAAVTVTILFVLGLSAGLFARDLLFSQFSEHYGWLAIRNITIYGLIATLLWIVPGSLWRAAPALAIVALTGTSIAMAPRGVYNEILPLKSLLPLRIVAPTLAVFIWSAAIWLAARLTRTTSQDAMHRSWLWRGVGPAAMLAVAAILVWYDPLDFAPLKAARVAVPAVFGIGWLILSFLREPAAIGRTGLWRWLGPVALGVCALLLYGYVDIHQQHAGLWRSVVCLDRDSGRVIWQRNTILAPAGKKYPRNSYATPTPVTDGRYVVADFSAGMACLDFNGKVLWTTIEPQFEHHLRYGPGSSPVIFGDTVIQTYMIEHPSGEGHEALNRHSYLRAIDLETGKEVWRVTPPGAHDSYGTPLISSADGQPLLLFVASTDLVAYDPRTGEQRWTCELPTKQVVPSLIADDQMVYVAGGTHYRAVLALPLTGTTGDDESSFKWKTVRNVPRTASPVLYDGLLYWVTFNGIAVCVDPSTGDALWRERIGGYHYASPVAADGKIYYVSDVGDVTVVQAGRQFNQIATNSLDEEIMASPAICDENLFLRGRRFLYCISNSGKPR